MNDLDIIKQLEQEIGRKLKKRKKITELEDIGYILNEEKQVTRLNLCEFKMVYMPKLIFKLKKIRVFNAVWYKN